LTSSLTPAGLRCAHKADPLGVAPDRVRFSWVLRGTGTGRAQSAYQVQVTDEAGAVSWDSGRVESASSADVAYPGEAAGGLGGVASPGASRAASLAGGARYRWKVQVWDETGAASGWSAPAAFEVELGRTGGWHASWISLGRIREDFRPPAEAGPSDPVVKALTPAPYLRRAFTVEQPVASARLYVTALGLYEARLNGQRVGDAVLAPGWTDYDRRIPYQTYDVTGLLRPGDNVLGAILADGWYCGFFGFDAKRAGWHYGEAPELLAQLVLRLADGSEQRVVTDQAWRAAIAAVRHADLLMGERHDLTREPRGWDAPGFDACGWRPVRCRERDATSLVADPGPQVRVTQEIAPRSIATDDHGRHIVDFGQNLRARLGRGVALPVPARHRPGTGHGRFRPAAGQAASRRVAQLGPWPLPVGPRAGGQRLATGWWPVHVPARAAAERHGQRAHPQPRPGRGPRRHRRRARGRGPVPGRPRHRRGRLRGRLGPARVLRPRPHRSRPVLTLSPTSSPDRAVLAPGASVFAGLEPP